MAEPYEKLAEEILGILRESAEDFRSASGVEAFLKETATDYAKWKWKAETATDPAKKAEYEGNLRDVKAQLSLEIARQRISLSKEAKTVLAKVAETVGNFVLKLTPELLGLLRP